MLVSEILSYCVSFCEVLSVQCTYYYCSSWSPRRIVRIGSELQEHRISHVSRALQHIIRVAALQATVTSRGIHGLFDTVVSPGKQASHGSNRDTAETRRVKLKERCFLSCSNIRLSINILVAQVPCPTLKFEWWRGWFTVS